jgi:hypothetical protein
MIIILCIVYPTASTFASDRTLIVYTSLSTVTSTITGYLIQSALQIPSVITDIMTEVKEHTSSKPRWHQLMRVAKAAAVVCVCAATLVPYEVWPYYIVAGILLTIMAQILPLAAMYYLFRGWDPKQQPQQPQTWLTRLTHDEIYQPTPAINHLPVVMGAFGIPMGCTVVAFCVGHMWIDQRWLAIALDSILLCIGIGAKLSYSNNCLFVTSTATTTTTTTTTTVTNLAESPSAPPNPAPNSTIQPLN